MNPVMVEISQGLRVLYNIHFVHEINSLGEAVYGYLYRLSSFY